VLFTAAWAERNFCAEPALLKGSHLPPSRAGPLMRVCDRIVLPSAVLMISLSAAGKPAPTPPAQSAPGVQALDYDLAQAR
jgi:hypothetical protein